MRLECGLKKSKSGRPIFKGADDNDTPFDENMYMRSHSLQGVFSKKAAASGARQMYPLTDESVPLMEEQEQRMAYQEQILTTPVQCLGMCWIMKGLLVCQHFVSILSR